MIRDLAKRIVNDLIRIRLNSSGKYYIERDTKVMHATIQEYVSLYKNVNVLWSEIGKYTYIGQNTELPYCRIGRFCSIGPHVILAAGLHPTHFVSSHPVLYKGMGYRFSLKGETKMGAFFGGGGGTFQELIHLEGSEKLLCEIGHDVWIATRVTLVCGKKPLHIGTGAVIGAGAVVKNDVPPYAIVAGNPARIIRYRFDKDAIEKLLESKWWEQDDEWICSHINLFENPDFIWKG